MSVSELVVLGPIEPPSGARHEGRQAALGRCGEVAERPGVGTTVDRRLK